MLLTAGICAAAFYVWHERSKYVEPEMLAPEVFEDVNYDTDLLIGLWQENSVFYRYNDDGSAVTWDVADDVLEEEGVQLTWTMNHNLFTHYYKMEIGGIVPKTYNMKQLELDVLEYCDDYGVNHKFSRVEEPDFIN